MFKPDIFSNGSPVFTKADNATSKEVVDFLKKHYSTIAVWEGAVYKSGAIELNSNNFMIALSNQKYILKREYLAEINNLAHKSAQANIVNKLANKKTPLPQILANDNEQLITTDQAACWYLMPYIQGDYFQGVGRELENVGYEMVGLFERLRNYVEPVNTLETIAQISANDIVFLSDKITNFNHLKEIFGNSHATLIDKNWEKIEAIYAKILDKKETLLSPMGVVHYDLHPHNLIMSSEKVAAFIDFSSFVIAPIGVTFSFNFFKQMRQAMVTQKASRLNDNLLQQRNNVINMAIRKHLLADSEHLALLAQSEILRRMLLIFKLNYQQHSTKWNHVLPLHLNALHEAEVIYAK